MDDARKEVETVCKRRGMTCEVQQKNSVNAVYSDEGLLEQLLVAIKDSQDVSPMDNHKQRGVRYVSKLQPHPPSPRCFQLVLCKAGWRF